MRKLTALLCAWLLSISSAFAILIFPADWPAVPPIECGDVVGINVLIVANCGDIHDVTLDFDNPQGGLIPVEEIVPVPDMKNGTELTVTVYFTLSGVGCDQDNILWIWVRSDNGIAPYMFGPFWVPCCETAEAEEMELGFQLCKNYPNPFNPATTIEYVMPETGYARLAVYTLGGREISELVNGMVARGVNRATFHGGNLPSGCYIYTLEAGGQVTSNKMILLK